jgi:hypothetical protein
MKFALIPLLLAGLALASPAPAVKRVAGPDINLHAESSPNVTENQLERRAETTTCYNIGTTIPRDLAVQGIAAFCAYQIGKSYGQNTEFYVSA